MQALGCPLAFQVVTRNKGEGTVITNSFHEKPKERDTSPKVPFMPSGISL